MSERDVFIVAKGMIERSDRVRYLAKIGEENQLLADRVRQLLEADDTTNSLFDTPPLSEYKDHSSASEVGFAQVAGFEIQEVLGRGGTSVVYKAEQLALKRTVALKVITAGAHAGPEQRARFRIEAEAAARLQHPNIVQIHEVGESGGYPYCSLEYVEGGTLADRLAGKPIPIHRAAKLVETLGRAMQLAHSRNIVHRDLKPANVMLTLDGTPKITDFGLARQIDRNTGATHTGLLMGTPSYMAPEQAAGQAHQAGPPADVYSLGAILYDCLTGRPPFTGGTLTAILDQVRMQEPIPPSRIVKGIPIDLETICLKCLRKQPEHRYASALELAEDLARFQNGESILARPVGSVERSIKWVKRNPILSGSALLLAFVFLSVTVAAFVVADRFRGMARTQTDLTNKEKASRLTAELALDVGRRELYHAETTLAMRSLGESGSTARLKAQLSRWAESPELGELFGWEHRLAQNLAEPISTNREWGESIKAFEYSPDGRSLAVGDRRLLLVEPDTLKILKEWEYSKSIKDIRWEPAGSRIAVSSQDHVALFDTRTGTRIWQQDAADNPRMVWDHQSRWLAFCDRKYSCTIADRDTGFVVKRLSQIDESFAFSPDGKYFAAAIIRPDTFHDIQLWRTSDWVLEKTVNIGIDFVFAVEWSPDGRRIAIGNAIGAVHVIDPVSGTRVQTLDANGRSCDSLAWRADGLWLASRNVRGEIRVWECDTWAEVPLTREPRRQVSCLRWRPFGVDLVLAGDETQFRSIRLHEKHAYWKFHFGTRLTNTSYLTCVWNPDSQSLAACGAAPGTFVWSVDGRRLNRVNGVEWQWSSDGKYSAGVLGEFVTVRTSTGQTLARVELPGQPKVLAWQPRTQTLAVRTANRLYLWNPAVGADPELVYGRPHTAGIDFVAGNAMVWSPDGTRLAFSESTGLHDESWLTRIMNVSDRSITTTFGEAKTQIFALAWSPDGQRIGIGRDEPNAWIYDAASGRRIVELVGHGGAIRSLMWHPSDNRLATGSADGTAKVWDTDQNRAVVTFDMGAVVRHVAWSPDGISLAAAEESGAIHVWSSRPKEPITSANR